MNVSAQDKSTGKSENITITNDKGRLTKEQIEKMVSEAEKFKDEDNKLRETIDERNGLESYFYQVKNSIQDEKIRDKLGDNKAKLESIIEEGINWVDNNENATLEEIKNKKSEFEGKINPIMSSLYQSEVPPMEWVVCLPMLLLIQDQDPIEEVD